MRHKLLTLVLAIVVITSLVIAGCAKPAPAPSPAPTPAEPIEIIISSPNPAPSGAGVAIDAFAKELEEVTNGRIKATVYHGGALGKGVEQYDLAVTGTADIALSNIEYYPGRFPLHEVCALPLLLPKDAMSAGKVLTATHEKFPEMQREFNDVKFVGWSGLASRVIHTAKKPVRTVDDFKGLKIRATGSISSATIEAMGAIPVVMAPTEVYTALERGTLDGVVWEWEGFHAFKLEEVAKYTTLVDVNTTAHFAVMNRAKYEGLPPDIREAIDTVMGIAFAKLYAGTMDRMGNEAFDMIKAGGKQEFYTPPAVEKERFVNAAMPVTEKWVTDMEAKGLPGKEFLEYITQLSAQYE